MRNRQLWANWIGAPSTFSACPFTTGRGMRRDFSLEGATNSESMNEDCVEHCHGHGGYWRGKSGRLCDCMVPGFE